MFVQISPNENDLSETLCSLNFASRVRGIELGPAKKQLESPEILRYKQLVQTHSTSYVLLCFIHIIFCHKQLMSASLLFWKIPGHVVVRWREQSKR